MTSIRYKLGRFSWVVALLVALAATLATACDCAAMARPVPAAAAKAAPPMACHGGEKGAPAACNMPCCPKAPISSGKAPASPHGIPMACFVAPPEAPAAILVPVETPVIAIAAPLTPMPAALEPEPSVPAPQPPDTLFLPPREPAARPLAPRAPPTFC